MTSLAVSDDAIDRSGKRENIATLLKPFTDDSSKYFDSTRNNFERKSMLFLERCDQADI